MAVPHRISISALHQTAASQRVTFSGPDPNEVFIPEYVTQESANGDAIRTFSPAGLYGQDMVLAFCGGVGTQTPIIDSGWNLEASVSGNSSSMYVWSRRWDGNWSSVSINANGISGCVGYVVYRGVNAIFATKGVSTTDNSLTPSFTPPSEWASLGYGHLAVLFEGNNSANDYPTNNPPFGWRRDINVRRWHNAVAAYAATDPAIWNSATLSGGLGYNLHAYCGLVLQGSVDNPSYIPTSTSRPGSPIWLDGSWNVSSITVPADANPGDMVGISIFSNNLSGIQAGDSTPGAWGIHARQWGNTAVASMGWIVQDGWAGTKVLQGNAESSQSHRWWRIPNVNPLFPLTGQKSNPNGTGSVLTHDNLTAGNNTIFFEAMGADIGDSTPNLANQSARYDIVQEHNRWNPWGANLVVIPSTNGESITGLNWDAQGSATAIGQIVEIRGV